jgi:SAM-dependent methyltransferase
VSQWCVEPAPSPDFDHFASSYGELLQDRLRSGFASDPLHFHRRKWIVLERLLRTLNRPPESMAWLDAGCGQGEFLQLAGPHFARATGCDPSAEMLSHGRSFATHRQPHPSELPFASQSFDLVTAICVYHHVDRSARQDLTREIRRVLRPGGLFCLIEHNPRNPVTRRIVSRCPVDAGAEILSLRAAMEIVRDSGLHALRSEYFLYLPQMLFRMLPDFEALVRKIPLGGQYVLVSRAPGRAHAA